MSELLEVTSVSKVYHNAGQQVFALRNVSFKAARAEYLAIVGPSGAGKSTLLHIAGGLDIPSSGKVVFEGKNIYSFTDRELSLWRNQRIGFIFQFYHLIEELTVLENVMISSQARGRSSSFKQGLSLLQYLGIVQRKDFFPSQLSGGQKQRAAIARALVNDPDVIFCDEPTGSLDKESRENVMGLIERLHKEMGKTVVLVTHNVELAKRAGRIILIEGGDLKA